MMIFTASSGNVARIEGQAKGGNLVLSVEWQRPSTVKDCRECNQFIRDTFKPVNFETLFENDEERRAAIFEERLNRKETVQ